MEGHRAQRLTTLAVAAGLLAALACLAAGALLGVRAEEEALVPLGFAALAAGLPEGRPAAWLSLGTLLLVATPCLRLGGLLFVFHARGQRRALAACACLLLLLLAGLGRALA